MKKILALLLGVFMLGSSVIQAEGYSVKADNGQIASIAITGTGTGNNLIAALHPVKSAENAYKHRKYHPIQSTENAYKHRKYHPVTKIENTFKHPKKAY